MKPHNKNKKLVTYYTLKGRVRKFESKRSTLDILTPFFILWATMIACLVAARFDTTQALEPQFINPHVNTVFTGEGVAATEAGQTTPEPKTEKQQIIDYITEVFGEDAPDAFNILYCENRQLDHRVVGRNRNGSIDEGVFQINSIHGKTNMKDWKTNIDYAKTIFDRQGWRPWTCATRINQSNYLGR